jgi:hypothetical protein
MKQAASPLELIVVPQNGSSKWFLKMVPPKNNKKTKREKAFPRNNGPFFFFTVTHHSRTVTTHSTMASRPSDQVLEVLWQAARQTLWTSLW